MVYYLLFCFAGDYSEGSTRMGMISASDAMLNSVGLFLEPDPRGFSGDDGLNV